MGYLLNKPLRRLFKTIKSASLSTSQQILKTNRLLPLFVKLENLRFLIVGNGEQAIAKLQAILTQSPEAFVTYINPEVDEQAKSIAGKHSSVQIKERSFQVTDLSNIDVVIVALEDRRLAGNILKAVKEKGILLHDTAHPEHSDFYFSKPEDSLADFPASETVYLKGSARSSEYTDVNDKEGEKRWKKIASRCVFAFFFMILGHWLLSYVPFDGVWFSVVEGFKQLDDRFFWMIATGFFAQLVDGALGMGYGVTCTTVLLSLGINLSAISGSIHTAEMFSSGASGYSHYRFGNVNKKLFKVLLIPGIVGAVAGAILLSKFGDKYADYVRPLLAAYTLILGLRIILVAFRKKKKPGKVKNAGWLAGAGGFLDSFGGGGWGPLVTSTLIAKGRTPRFVIGTVSITEFFVTFATALTFFTQIGISHWQVILGLIVGGMVAAPLAARLSGKLPVKTSFIAVGAMVIFWSLRILIKALQTIL